MVADGAAGHVGYRSCGGYLDAGYAVARGLPEGCVVIFKEEMVPRRMLQ